MGINFLRYCNSRILVSIVAFLIFHTGIGCSNNKQVRNSTDTIPILIDSSKAKTPPPSLPSLPSESKYINTGNTTPQEVLDYAKSLMGTPYKYGSIDPAVGFDCSGFITHVFNHFNISVPRSSIDFTDVNRPVDISDAKSGDLILFTGTDSLERDVGHMGIIVTGSDDGISFIHSTSGKAYGVTITPFNEYYQGRFVKVIRIFKENEQ